MASLTDIRTYDTLTGEVSAMPLSDHEERILAGIEASLNDSPELSAASREHDRAAAKPRFYWNPLPWRAASATEALVKLLLWAIVAWILAQCPPAGIAICGLVGGGLIIRWMVSRSMRNDRPPRPPSRWIWNQ